MQEKIITDAKINGNLIFDGKLIIKNDLVISGCIEAKIIIAEKGLSAGRSITAGGSITAGTSIEARGYIMAGGSITAGGYIFSFIFFVRAKAISTHTLPFWRDYWAEMLPLKKWRQEILSGKCWDDYRKMISKAEAKKICAWPGWHWLLRAQLEMFFGLKDSVTPPATGDHDE